MSSCRATNAKARYEADTLLAERDRLQAVVEKMARHWKCERWAPHAFGETPRFVGCEVYRDPDPATYCLGCEAQAALDAAPAPTTNGGTDE